MPYVPDLPPERTHQAILAFLELVVSAEMLRARDGTMALREHDRRQVVSVIPRGIEDRRAGR